MLPIMDWLSDGSNSLLLGVTVGAVLVGTALVVVAAAAIEVVVRNFEILISIITQLRQKVNIKRIITFSSIKNCLQVL